MHQLVYLLLLSLFLSTKAYSEHFSLEEKVGQLFFGFIYGEELSPQIEEFLKETSIGNIIYYRWANGLHSPEQVRRLSSQITSFLKIPAFIAVDQEGGRVARLKEGFRAFTSNAVLGALNDSSYVELASQSVAKELKEVGINVNLAPVVDVNSNPSNPVIADRSYSPDPLVVAAMAGAFLRGHRKEGVLTVLKHFPGHGDTQKNSHRSLPVVDKTRAELEQTELRPFNALVSSADMIMTAHILLPALDPNCCATFSSKILEELLKKEWNYQGLVLSDSLVMRASSPNQRTLEEAIESVSQAAIAAFNAGCDCLLLGALEWADFKTTPADNIEMQRRVLKKFSQAVKNGQVSPAKLDQSFQKIVHRKKSIKEISL